MVTYWKLSSSVQRAHGQITICSFTLCSFTKAYCTNLKLKILGLKWENPQHTNKSKTMNWGGKKNPPVQTPWHWTWSRKLCTAFAPPLRSPCCTLHTWYDGIKVINDFLKTELLTWSRFIYWKSKTRCASSVIFSNRGWHLNTPCLLLVINSARRPFIRRHMTSAVTEQALGCFTWVKVQIQQWKYSTSRKKSCIQNLTNVKVCQYYQLMFLNYDISISLLH